jgi:acyl carrier protein
MVQQSVRGILADILQLADGGSGLQADTPLLGALPELDSMAVVSVITALEDSFGFVVEDEEISADTFATFGTLVSFVQEKSSA